MNKNFLKLSNFSLFLFVLAVTTADLDGDQVLEFYWVDPIEAASFMNAGLIFRCLTCSQWNRFSESCLSYQLAKQERFHTACGSTRRILSARHSIQERGQVTEAGCGISTRGP